MVFERPYGAFGSIGPMFLGWDSLIVDLVLVESVFEGLGTLVVEDMKAGRVALLQEQLMGSNPGIVDAGSLAVGYGNGVNRVSVVVI